MPSCTKNGRSVVRYGIGTYRLTLNRNLMLIHGPLRSREKAHEVFQMGIHRKAQPLKRLQTSYQTFQNRAADPSGVITTATPSSVAPSSAQRRVLGDRSSAARGLSAQQSSHTGLPDNGARLDVFTDGSDTRRRLDEKDGEWADFGTREQNRRENVKEASTWKGEVLPQSAKAVARIAPRTPKMEVFRDTVSVNEGLSAVTWLRIIFTDRVLLNTQSRTALCFKQTGRHSPMQTLCAQTRSEILPRAMVRAALFPHRRQSLVSARARASRRLREQLGPCQTKAETCQGRTERSNAV